MEQNSFFSEETSTTTYMGRALVSAVLVLTFLSLDFFFTATLQVKATTAIAAAAAAPARTREAEAVARNLALAWNRGDSGENSLSPARSFARAALSKNAFVRSRAAVSKNPCCATPSSAFLFRMRIRLWSEERTCSTA
jgi:hypothetical protein